MHRPDLRLEDLARRETETNDLFTSYQANGPVRWNQDWPWQLDLSGVAWDSPATATAITPRHVVMADHFKRSPGDGVVFHDRRGRPHSRRIMSCASLKDHGLPCDLAVGLLDQPLPGEIRTYPLPAPGGNPLGRLALVTDQHRSLYFHRISTLQGHGIVMSHDPALPVHSRKHLVTGDSGNPSFLLSKGELVLVETHTMGGPGSGPWFGSADIQAALRKAMASLDPSAAFRTVPLEP